MELFSIDKEGTSFSVELHCYEDQDIREKFWLFLTGIGQMIDGLTRCLSFASCSTDFHMYFSLRLSHYRIRKQNQHN